MSIDLARFRVPPRQRISLSRYDPGDTAPFRHKRKAVRRLERGIERLVQMQDRLYAQDRWSVLVIVQALDAAGKDSVIKHVMSGLNPQGTQVYAFKRPSDEELDHDYLWRTARALPERGRIGIFNRSYYEEVLVVRVHADILARQKLPPSLVTRRIWEQRYEDINTFERYLTRNGTMILKFCLNVSKDEQRRRLLERLDEPAKNWKFQLGDLAERDRWSEYRRAYERMLSATSTPYAPWYVVPADHKWFTRLVVADLIVDALERLDLRYPTVTPAQMADLAKGRELLKA